MSKLIDLSNPESRNWLKQWRAVYITRQALLPTVSEEANQLHGDIIQKAPVPACTTCSFKDVQKKNASCKFHPFFRNELVIKHAHGKAKGIGALTLKNTKPENWINSPWEIAKVFMPPSGYENKNTIEKTDFNGIAGFMINCNRFQGKITDTVCIKAREVVNHIRHIPDISSSDLTDLATTECIDNLYALLNEPALNTRPEVVLACKQLDELKTADPSNDENTYMYICKEIHSGFEQRLADIEMQLQTKETDTKSAKETLHTCSKQICETLKHLSGDAMHNLSKTKDDILRSIEEESRRVKNHITFLERKATEQIEQSITDGKTTLATHTAEEKRRAKEYIEQCVTEGKRTLKDETERLAKQLPKAEVESLQDKKRKLKTQLIQHYKITSSKMNLRLFIDETIEHIYEKPKLILKKIKKMARLQMNLFLK